MRFAIALLMFVMFAGIARAQSEEQNAEEKKQGNANSLEPYYPKEKQVPKKAKKKSSSRGATYESEQQYYDRMAKVFKEKEKAEKEMQKPQYANPMYFGHKRPPKKRKPGKMKFCRECGLKH
jgi:hypothetical protein